MSQDQIFIQHRFTVSQDGKDYSDAIVLPQAEYEKLTKADIDSLKAQRFDTWKQAIDNPPVVVETPKELLIASIDEQIKGLQAQKDQLIALPIKKEIK